jgi:hypothetical protein
LSVKVRHDLYAKYERCKDEEVVEFARAGDEGQVLDVV